MVSELAVLPHYRVRVRKKVMADAYVRIDNRMRQKHRLIADGYALCNDDVRPNMSILAEDRGRMDHRLEGVDAEPFAATDLTLDTLDQLAFMPHAIPGIVMGVAFLWLFLEGRRIGIDLFGGVWSIAIAFSIGFIAFGTRSMNAASACFARETSSGYRPNATPYAQSIAAP